jgi:hypothetical protein
MLGEGFNLLKGLVAAPLAAGRAAYWGAKGVGYTMRGGRWLAGQAGRGVVSGVKHISRGRTAGTSRLGRIAGGGFEKTGQTAIGTRLGPAKGVGGSNWTENISFAVAPASQRAGANAARWRLGARVATGDILRAGVWFGGAELLDTIATMEPFEDSTFGKGALSLTSFYLKSRGYRAGIRTPISFARGATFGTKGVFARKTASLFRKYNEYAYWPEKRLFGEDRAAPARAAAKAKLQAKNAGLGIRGVFEKIGRDPGSATGYALKTRWPSSWWHWTVLQEPLWHGHHGTNGSGQASLLGSFLRRWCTGGCQVST